MKEIKTAKLNSHKVNSKSKLKNQSLIILKYIIIKINSLLYSLLIKLSYLQKNKEYAIKLEFHIQLINIFHQYILYNIWDIH